jgi:integrase
MKALTAIILDQRKALKSGKYPIKLRVTFNRKQKFHPTKYSFTKEEFDKVISKYPKGEFKTARLGLDLIEQKANEIIDAMQIFDFNIFNRRLHRNEKLRENVYAYYEKVISEYKTNDQLGTASNYTCSLHSLQKFKINLSFWEVTPEFLKGFQKFLVDNGKSITTVGIYLRPLRSIINRAIADETIPKDFSYPFGSKAKLKYQIPTGKSIKKALDKRELKLLFEYKPIEDTWEEKALDFWKFSYLANGMNMKDIANLRFKDVQSDFIYFIRAKTKNTNSVETPIKVFLSEYIKKIIVRWGNLDKKASNLIFSIINQNDNLEKQRADLHQFIKMVNKYVNRIARTLYIEKSCNTYVARHSMATMLIRSGANVQAISEALGHSTVVQTKCYLKPLEDDVKKEMAKALTNFN